MTMVSLRSASFARVASLVLALGSIQAHGFDNTRNDDVFAMASSSEPFPYGTTPGCSMSIREK